MEFPSHFIPFLYHHKGLSPKLGICSCPPKGVQSYASDHTRAAIGLLDIFAFIFFYPRLAASFSNSREHFGVENLLAFNFSYGLVKYFITSEAESRAGSR